MRVAITISALTFLISSCETVKQAELFEAPAKKPVPENVRGFYGVSIFDEEMTAEFWGEENKTCFNAQLDKTCQPFGEYAMRVDWNKDIGVCDWIGMGFGWNGWMAKDMQAVFDSIALSMMVKPVEGSFSNLPVALGFEDFSGKQAWLGFGPRAVVSEKAENGWTRIEFPLSEFNWAEQGANPANIKQLIIQLEAVGAFYFDEIKMVERIGGFDKRYNVAYNPELSISLDGKADEKAWEQAETAKLEGANIKLVANDSMLYMFGSISDPSPLLNGKSEGDIWNGDGIEMALRVNPNNDLGLARLSSADRHIGVAMSDSPSAWAYDKSQAFSGVQVKTQTQENGYSYEIAFSLKELGIEDVLLNKIHPFELAVNQGNASRRESQKTWNSPQGANFYQNLSSWGELVFVPSKLNN